MASHIYLDKKFRFRKGFVQLKYLHCAQRDARAMSRNDVDVATPCIELENNGLLLLDVDTRKRAIPWYMQ